MKPAKTQRANSTKQDITSWLKNNKQYSLELSYISQVERETKKELKQEAKRWSFI